MVVVSMYLRQIPNTHMPSIDRCMHQLLKEVSLLYLLPVTQLHKVRVPLSCAGSQFWPGTGVLLCSLGASLQA